MIWIDDLFFCTSVASHLWLSNLLFLLWEGRLSFPPKIRHWKNNFDFGRRKYFTLTALYQWAGFSRTSLDTVQNGFGGFEKTFSHVMHTSDLEFATVKYA
jgi:hypothetical protein